MSRDKCHQTQERGRGLLCGAVFQLLSGAERDVFDSVLHSALSSLALSGFVRILLYDA